MFKFCPQNVICHIHKPETQIPNFSENVPQTLSYRENKKWEYATKFLLTYSVQHYEPLNRERRKQCYTKTNRSRKRSENMRETRSQHKKNNWSYCQVELDKLKKSFIEHCLWIFASFPVSKNLTFKFHKNRHIHNCYKLIKIL